MSNFRVFVEKLSKFNVEARGLRDSIKQNFNIDIPNLRVINLYDVFNITKQELEQAKYIVFSEPTVDTIVEQLEISHDKWFAVEPLPGQYDQRADSAFQALNLIGINNQSLQITTGKVIILDESTSLAQLESIKKYYINPLENQNKNLNVLDFKVEEVSHVDIPIYDGFNESSHEQLQNFRKNHGLAMTDADLECIQNYFRSEEKRNPTETEICVLDTYWSDHCRHTTFETYLTDISFTDGKYKTVFENIFNHYQTTRQNYYGARITEKPVTLMDLATICGKEMKKRGALDNVEVSDEINACSLIIDIKVDGKPQKWSLQFKNETHNHPTEIEPYGGASTCVGGAIRDPLSGRSYVYQAMRISGAANPLEKISDTLAGKLPQKIITTKAAHGFSSYGNQIGLTTTFVREIYHDGYKAKRMEVGVVVAAAPYENIRREKSVAGDVIILLGGRTGRDGCGGATGSSKEHDNNSAKQCGAEVQKGNPVVERKIQRLFRNKELTRLIKKCNDFGAGGVSVAIGELADGVLIDLDKVPTKYNGLTGTELAISESQERMAVIVSPTDVEKFIALAAGENLEAVKVADVTDQNRMTMLWNGKKIVDLSRDFLNTNGAKSYAKAMIHSPNENNKPRSIVSSNSFTANLKELLQNLNIASQRGLVDAFDATIGASTVLMPFGGKYQLTPTQVSAQLLPVVSGSTDTASIASFGYDADVSSWSPFHGAYFAVIDSIAKVVACGGDFREIRFSFQEYFEKLCSNSEKWGKPFAALLGAYAVQQGFELAAIGGKDSMSGTFNDIHVPPTLISFAVAPADANKIISPEIKSTNANIYLYQAQINADSLCDLAKLKQDYLSITELIHSGAIEAAYAVGKGGIAESLFLMSIGNKIGTEIQSANDLFDINYGSLILVTKDELKSDLLQKIATTNDSENISFSGESISLSELVTLWDSKLLSVFPLTKESTNKEINLPFAKKSCNSTSSASFTKPRVIVPVFPGTNSEYDTIKAFELAGAEAHSMVFRNLSATQIDESINELVANINKSQILMLPGGFSAGDEPDGSAKFIAAILRNNQVKDAVHDLLDRDGLILGICNGFQALVKSGLLPYGEIRDLDNSSPTLTYNLIGRHISRVVPTKIVSTMSPWLSSFNIDDIHNVAMSHGEGRFVISNELAEELATNGQIASQYADLSGLATADSYFNPNGSDFAIEAITSADGRILGKMGHSERKGKHLYKNIPDLNSQDIFVNGVNYFK
ncbi:MAG: phosphoribosylformylglycinamidine synthase [Burkholderiales bacterium]|nr:phosphoribosylformylglycinamidine synthase [Burkholderiales bacterium]